MHFTLKHLSIYLSVRKLDQLVQSQYVIYRLLATGQVNPLSNNNGLIPCFACRVLKYPPTFILDFFFKIRVEVLFFLFLMLNVGLRFFNLLRHQTKIYLQNKEALCQLIFKHNQQIKFFVSCFNSFSTLGTYCFYEMSRY